MLLNIQYNVYDHDSSDTIIILLLYKTSHGQVSPHIHEGRGA